MNIGSAEKDTSHYRKWAFPSFVFKKYRKIYIFAIDPIDHILLAYARCADGYTCF